ncbi:hypothetical protein D3C71_2002160 [compost metagenome]
MHDSRAWLDHPADGADIEAQYNPLDGRTDHRVADFIVERAQTIGQGRGLLLGLGQLRLHFLLEVLLELEDA